MEVLVTRKIVEEVDVKVDDVTLLSVKEAESIPNDILIADRWWWLRSPGRLSDYAAYVHSFGRIGDYGHVAVSDYGGVRPALKIRNLESLGLENGDKIELAMHKWTIVCGKYALCDDIVGSTAFRADPKAADANDYEKSDVKKWLRDWARDAGIEIEVAS